MGHDDFGLAEEFVRRTDLTGPLGSGLWGLYGGYEFGDAAKMLGLDDWIANIVPFCGGFAALSDFLMDPFLVAGFSSENSGGRTEHPCAEKRSFGVLDGRWDLHGSTSDII